jgi:primase-polymerase (primpol)-like protein
VLEGLRIRIGEIQVNIESYRKQRSVLPKNNADSTSMPQKIKALEYRLSTQLQKFNQAVDENKSMRKRIDQLRKECVVFNMIYRQSESDIKGKREELIAIMAKTDKAEKARDESRTELDKVKELFQNDWNEVVEKSVKEQNETTFSLGGGEKDKAAEAIKVESIKEETASITKSGKKDKNAKNSSERKGDVANKAPGHHVDPEANTYANKLRSTTARAAWAVARDTG